MEVFQTNIICDGSGFSKSYKKDEGPDFSKYKFNNFRVSDNKYLIKLENPGGALIISDDGELMLNLLIQILKDSLQIKLVSL